MFPAIRTPSIGDPARKVQNDPTEERHSSAFACKVSGKQSKNHGKQMCHRSLTQRASRLPLSLFVALMASEHPEVRFYLWHQQLPLGSVDPSLSGLQTLSQSLCVDIAVLSCPCTTATRYCPIKALGSKDKGSRMATHRGKRALTCPASHINRLHGAVSL